ncbi:succinylglutamate desuccinylase/aspartoacylase family protein [Halomicroarcula limicola]|uniref:Succinylglutamate desuccinylase/aspartoacylase family protein n=1 Tax=Haloarcula limicola TaxID=1429915 RepID=A0A8J7YCY2_9EURY|nr:succinylglutamate desuccinylase/aspartoacylase family protein [Halomicroarcula limicola]MBV0926193.1 succinylglutamate desuccinylase/aspartoacylase family protein [Halomicroarcula limicola]
MEYEPVSHAATQRRLGRLPSGADVTATVHRYDGGAGPTVYVQAAQHGIELNGPAALRRLHDRLLATEVAGTVIVVPVANSLAFDHRSYATPSAYDVMNPNMNRVWPGDSDGTLQERLADRLWDLVSDADAAIDLHTGTADMLEHVRFQAGRPAARTLATAFGTKHLLSDEDDASDDDFSGKFRTAAAREDIPAITAELRNSRQVTRSAIESGVEGVLNVLRAVDALEPVVAEPPEQRLLRDDATAAVAAESGLFEARPDVAVGDRVDAGDELGTVYCPSSFDRLQTVTAEDSGVAYSLTREAVVVAGERLAGIGTPV